MPVEIKSHPWYHREHHRPKGGFRNIWGPTRPQHVVKAVKWMVGHGLARKEHRLPPVRPLDAAALAAPPERLRVTWIGHASTLVQTPTRNLLFDPVFYDRVSPFSFLGPARHGTLPCRLEDLPRIDLVVHSHDHYDHLDRDAVKALHARHRPLFLAPRGVDRHLRRWGVDRVAAFDWWQYADLDGARVHCTPAKHFSGRGLHNRDSTLWAGWYLELDGATLYYVGDSAYAGLFSEIRDRLGAPDVAIIPIGAYLPRWFMQTVHVDPEEAVRVLLDVGATHGIAVHWGTFDLAGEALHDPPAALATHAAAQQVADRFHVLDIGGQFELEKHAVLRGA